MGALTNPAPASAGSAGTPVLYGPYVVDYTDIPHDGDTLTLWVPAVGDVLLQLMLANRSAATWDHGDVNIGSVAHPNFIAASVSANILFYIPTETVDGFNGLQQILFSSADPLVAQFAAGGDTTPPTQGHFDLYAQVARAVAP